MQVDQAAGPVEQSRQAIEAIETADSRNLTFDWIRPDDQPIKKVYVQAELGFLPAQEFVVRISDVIESFMEGDMGMRIGDLFSGRVEKPVSTDPDAVNSFVDENKSIIEAFIKAVQILPDLQLDVICMSLGIPRKEREWAKTQLSEPPHRGGLTVEEGLDILTVFIRQNARLIKERAMGKARHLVEVFQMEVLDQEPKVEETATSAQEAAMMPEPASHGGTPSTTSSPDIPASV